MAVPVPGYRVTTGYKVRGSWSAGYHTGVDLAAPSGAKVVAMRAGRVVHVGWGGWGNAYGAQVIIDQGGGVRTAYCHLSRTMVSVGAQVAEGQQIGAVGTTGNSTGPHLHVECRTSPFAYNNVIADPQQFFGSAGGGGGGGATYLSKLHFGQQDSDSVRALQRALNAHSLAAPGNITLPITGNYGPKTDQVVRADQAQHGGQWGEGAVDPEGRSSVGPRQAAHLGLPGVRP